MDKVRFTSTHTHVPQENGVWMGEEGPPLPAKYERPTVHAMPCDPNQLFVYWNLSSAQIRGIRSMTADLQPFLRLLNINDQVIHQSDVELEAGCAYVYITPSRVFRVQIGVHEPTGGFHTLVHSERLRPVTAAIEPMLRLSPWNTTDPVPPLPPDHPMQFDLPGSTGMK